MIYSKTKYKALGRDIIIMSLCFSIVPMLIISVTLYYNFQSAWSETVTDALRRASQNVKRALVMFLDDQCAQLLTIANTHVLSSLMDERYLSGVFDLIRSRSNSLVDLGVIDDHGAHLAYVGPHYEELKAVNYSNEDWFFAVMERGVFISDVFPGFRKIPHVIIAVARREGGQTWILRATINTSLIDSLVREARLGKKGDAFIVNSDGILQTASRFHGSILARATYPDLDLTGESTLMRASISGVETIFTVAKIDNPKWTLVVIAQAFEQMGPFVDARFLACLSLIMCICVTAIGIVWVARILVNRYARQEIEKAKEKELLIQSSKMAALGKMAAGVAHEINNPLQIISDQAGWLKDLLKDEDLAGSKSLSEFRECAAKIQRAVDRCRSVTHRLLAFGRRMEPSQESVVVNEALQEVISLIESEAAHRGIQVITDLQQDLPVITTDKKQLQQVFLNILDNAVEAVGSSGTVTVGTRFHKGGNDNIVISIADTGPGIPKAVQGRIFDPFFTTKSTTGQAGLGLSIAYRILEKLGGTVSVESEIGHGSTFVITIPSKCEANIA